MGTPNFLSQFNPQAYAIGQGPINLGVQRNPGGTGEVQGNPNDYMRSLFDMMRRIHGYRQTMGNYVSDGGPQNVNT